MLDSNRYFLNSKQDYSSKDNIFSSGLKDKISQSLSLVIDHQPPSRNDCEGGLYVGGCGIGYMLYHVSQSPVFAADKQKLIKHGLDYIKVSLSYVASRKIEPKTASAFLLGSAGIYAVAAVLFNSSGKKDEAYACISDFVKSSKSLKESKRVYDELFVGRAGYLAGAIWLNRIFGEAVVPLQDVNDMCARIVQSGRQYSKERKCSCPLMYSYYDTEYLGAAHGLSSILQMLLSCDSFIQEEGNAKAVKDIRDSVDFLLGLQTNDGNFPCALGERSKAKDELVHWCHGASGVVYLMAKAYRMWGDTRYLDACLKCGELVWSKGLLKKGPGICHGVAGSGYVFLLLYRLTQDQKHLHRAHVFAAFIFDPEFQAKARTPDCPYSLYEGLAGTVCFLVDLQTPDSAAFPFQDVF